MRPTIDVPASPRFECVECGSRTGSTDVRACDGCGGRLLNLAVERDL